MELACLVALVLIGGMALASERLRTGVESEFNPPSAAIHDTILTISEGYIADTIPTITIIASHACTACVNLLNEIEPELVRAAHSGQLRYKAISLVPPAGGMELALTMVETCSPTHDLRWSIRGALRRHVGTAQPLRALAMESIDTAGMRDCMRDEARRIEMLRAGKRLIEEGVDHVPFIIVGDRVIRRYRDASAVARYIRGHSRANVHASGSTSAGCSTSAGSSCSM